MASLWAQHEQFGTACRDGSSAGGAFPGGSDVEQFGWDAGITFPSLANLADQCDPSGTTRRAEASRACGAGTWYSDPPRCGLRAGEVSRLAILCHGAHGRLFVNGATGTIVSGQAPSSGRDPLTAGSVRGHHRPMLRRIGLLTSRSAWIYLMGCNCASGPLGEQFLIALTGVWPGRTVVGYTFYGGRDPRTPADENCLGPGMRDLSGAVHRGSQDATIRGAPWASDVSPGAVHARNGRIVNRILWNPGVDHAPGRVTGSAPRHSTQAWGLLRSA